MSKFEISRVTRSKAAAQASYNRLSRWYDWLAASERPFRQQGLVLLNAQPGEHILEIGCGTGDSLVTLAQAVGASGLVYGLDLSPGMLRVSNDRIAREALTGRVALTCGDALTLPYPDGSLDAVFMGFTLELFDTPELPLVLAEVNRVLRANGRFCVVSIAKIPGNLRVGLYELTHALLPTFVDCRPIYARQLLVENGFEVVDGRQESMRGIPIEILLAQKAVSQPADEPVAPADR